MLRTRIPLFVLFTVLLAGCSEPASREVAPDPSSAPVATSEAAGVETASIGGVPRLTRSGDLYFAGQPAPDDFPALREAGITRIVNLRHPAEMGPFDEGAAAREHGMAYVSLPWNGPAELTDDVFDRTRQLLTGSDEPTLVHCSSSNRVGAVWLPYRVLDQGVSLETAVREAREAGMRSPEYEAIARDYIARNR